MGKLLTLFTFAIAVFAQSKTIQTISGEKFSAKHVKRLGEDEDFYQAVYADKTSDGFAVIDLGNNKIKVYDKSFNKIHEFGKEGLGPKEFQYISYFTVLSNDNILITNTAKILIFKPNGALVTEFQIPASEYGMPQIIPVPNGFYLKSQYINDGENTYKFDLSGNLVKKFNVPLKVATGISPKNITFYNRPFHFQSTFVEAGKKAFSIQTFNSLFVKKTLYTMSFNRIKRNWEKTFSYQTIIKDGKQKRVKVYGRTKENILKLDDYYRDIKRIIGSYAGNLYVSVATDDATTNRVFVFNKEFNFIGELTFKHARKLYDFRMRDGYFFLSQANDDIGAFVDIYKLDSK